MSLSSSVFQHAFVLFFASSMLLSGVVVAPDPDPYGGGSSFSTSQAVVMEQGDIWPVRTSRTYHQNRCKVKLQQDGNFLVKRLVGPYANYQYYRTSWRTNIGPARDGKYYAKLEEHDGSLVVYRDEGSSSGDEEDWPIYSSNVGDPEALNDYVTPLPRVHVLTITEECVLKLFRDEKELWSNNRYGGLGGEAGISDYLQKGEMVHMNVCYRFTNDPSDSCLYYPNTLLLQHDCNLIQFRGRDMADLKEDRVITWASHSSNTTVQDCYLYEDEDTLRLYAGTLDKSLKQFDPRPDPVLWTADDDFQNPCGGGYEVLLDVAGGLVASC